MSEQKTEQASPRRLLKAREEGQFPVSRSFVSAVQFLTFLGLIHSQAGTWFHTFRQSYVGILTHALDPRISARDLMFLVFAFARVTLTPIAVMGAILITIALAFQFVVTKFGISGKLLMPDLKRLDPLSKLKQLPRQNFPATMQALIMVPVFGATLYYLVTNSLEDYLSLPLQNLAVSTARVIGSIESLLWKAGGLFLIFGLVDLVRTKARYSKDLKMTKQEVRDEMKEVEGNPQVKAQIRRLRRDLARRNMMKEVPTATAVIVNPTHYAVALKYDRDNPGAPKVVAKGKNYLALRIRKLATDNGVPIVENPPLAQGLYKSIEVGQEIPSNFYKAVAEILAYIFRLTNPRQSAR